VLFALFPSYARGKGGVKRNPLISIACEMKTDLAWVLGTARIDHKNCIICWLRERLEGFPDSGCKPVILAISGLTSGYTVDAHVWAQYVGNDN
jgi:hypothetical protein